MILTGLLRPTRIIFLALRVLTNREDNYHLRKYYGLKIRKGRQLRCRPFLLHKLVPFPAGGEANAFYNVNWKSSD